MSNCIDGATEFYFDAANIPSTYLSNKMHHVVIEVEYGSRSSWEYLWIYPINLAASVIGLALAPIAFLMNMAAAAVFFCFSCGSLENRFKAKAFFISAIAQATDIPFRMFISIFYPPIIID